MEVIYVRPDRCVGCKTCEIECRIAHAEEKNLFAAINQDRPPKRRLFVEQDKSGKTPVLCRHCEEAPCIADCISGSLYRDEKGIVRRKKERCIGCWSCIMACPFGVIVRDADTHIAVKCDQCHDLDIPACVAGCPTKALQLVDVDSLPKERRKKLLLKKEV